MPELVQHDGEKIDLVGAFIAVIAEIPRQVAACSDGSCQLAVESRPDIVKPIQGCEIDSSTLARQCRVVPGSGELGIRKITPYILRAGRTQHRTSRRTGQRFEGCINVNGDGAVEVRPPDVGGLLEDVEGLLPLGRSRVT